MVGVEAAVERRDQGRVLGLEPASGQIGQPVRVAFAGDEGFEHVPHRQTANREATDDTLINASSSSFSAAASTGCVRG